MKLLYITNGYPPNRWAGTETYTAGIAEGFKIQGNKVNVICVGKWQEGHQYFNGISIGEHNGVPVHRLDFNWAKAPDPFKYLYNNPVTAGLIKGYLSDLKPDLVHVTSCETLSASVLKVVRELGIPLVLSLTDFWFLCPRFNLLRSDGDNCDGNTLAWDCLRCQLLESKAYRYPRSMLPESSVAWLLTEISKHPFLTRRRGLRGMAGNMAQRKAFLKQALNWPDYRVTASPFVRDVFVSTGVECPIQVQAYGHDLSWLKGWQGKDSSDKIRFGFIGQIIESEGGSSINRSCKFPPGKIT